MTTKSQQTNADFAALLRARNSLFWFVSVEETRVERAIVDAASALKYEVVFWDSDQGFIGVDGRVVAQITDPFAALLRIRTERRRIVYVMRDLAPWLHDPSVLRRLRSLSRELENVPRNEARAIVVLTPSSEIPPELSDHVVTIDYPLPEREEIAAILDD